MIGKTHRVVCALAAALVAVTQVAFSSDTSCDSAYWDGRKLQDFARCHEAAIAGDAEAEFQYALILWSGHDRKADHKSALEWLRKSARQGHRLAQVSLGSFLSHKDIEPQLGNSVEAYAWFVAAGALDSANKVKALLTQRQLDDAERLALEYRSKYGQDR